MKTFIKLIAGFMSLSPLLGAIACGPGGAGGEEVAIIVSQKTNPYFSTMLTKAKEHMKKYGKKIQEFDSEDKTEKELENVKTAISNGAEIILINVVNSDTSNAVKYAISKNVKVIALDRLINNTDGISGSIYTDNVLASEELGTKVKETIDSNSKITFTVGNSLQLRGKDSSASTDRDKGFVQGFPSWTGIKKEKANFNRLEGKEKTKTLLTNIVSLNVIYAENDEMALGAVNAMRERYSNGKLYDNNNILIAGFDGTSDAYKAIRDGHLFATVKQQPGLMAIYGVDWAMKLLDINILDAANAKIIANVKDKNLKISGQVITKENVPA